MIGKITNANAYLNGQSLVGKLDDIKMPEIEQAFEEYKAIGLVGEVEIPVGLKKMEAKLKWKAFYVADFLQMANFQQTQSIIVRGNQEEFDQLGRVVQKGVVVSLRGMFQNVPLGNIAAKEWKDMETTFKIVAVSLVIDNVLILDIDVLSNTYIVGGKNLYAGMSSNS